MRLIGEGAEIGLDERNRVVDERLLKRAEVKGASARAGARRSRVGWAGTTDAAVLHHDDERLAFSLGDQVVHNQTGVALAAPTCFIFAATMLEVEHRVAFARVFLVIGWRVNVDV